jgi:soluble lytic murein transglycosylase-like protein
LRAGSVRDVAIVAAAGLMLAGCSSTSVTTTAFNVMPADRPPVVESAVATAVEVRAPAGVDGLIAKYAAVYDVPESLIRRIIDRESGYNPKARNGPYWGLMQIRYDTAQTMGYRGPAAGLLDPDTNLRYGVKYLAGAWRVGGYDADEAERNYASGYYYQARAQGLLDEIGFN